MVTCLLGEPPLNYYERTKIMKPIINNQRNLYYAFTCDKRMNYYQHIYETSHVKNGSVDSIYYGIHDRCGGCVCEMRMTWYLLDDKEYPRLEVFSESFDELSKEWHLDLLRHIKFLGKKDFTASEFSRMLISLGFEDESDVKLSLGNVKNA